MLNPFNMKSLPLRERGRDGGREMPSLASLEGEFPIIDSNFQHFCASHNIFSVEDFLVHDLYVLEAFAERHSSSKELKQGITQVLSIIDSLHQPWLNGEELLENAKQKHVLSTGCEGIDVLLQGGLRKGQLTELVGPSSCGKTQACLQAAACVANRCRGIVMFLDTCNSFSSKRIADLASCHLGSSSKEVNQKSLPRVMSSIFCHSVFDIFTLLGVLNRLELNLRMQVKNEDKKISLLIVDSISSLISPILGGKDSHGHSLMVSVGFLLKRLADEYNLSILVTNHMVGGEGGILKPALGESWKTIPHVRLLLSRDHGSNICSVSVLKHTCMALGQVGRFTIPE